MTIQEQIKQFKPQQTIYIPPRRAGEWVRLKRKNGYVIGSKLLDMAGEFEKMKDDISEKKFEEN